jgi:hypothetical protein
MVLGHVIYDGDLFYGPFNPGEAYFSSTIPYLEKQDAIKYAEYLYREALADIDADKSPVTSRQRSFKSLKGRHEKEQMVWKRKNALLAKLKSLGPLHCPARYVSEIVQDEPDLSECDKRDLHFGLEGKDRYFDRVRAAENAPIAKILGYHADMAPKRFTRELKPMRELEAASPGSSLMFSHLSARTEIPIVSAIILNAMVRKAASGNKGIQSVWDGKLQGGQIPARAVFEDWASEWVSSQHSRKPFTYSSSVSEVPTLVVWTNQTNPGHDHDNNRAGSQGDFKVLACYVSVDKSTLSALKLMIF